MFKYRKIKLVGHVARMEGVRSTFSILTGKPRGKRPLERIGRRLEDNFRLDIKEIGINARNLLDCVQDSDY